MVLRLKRLVRITPLALEAGIATTMAWLVLRGPRPAFVAAHFVSIAKYWPRVASFVAAELVANVVVAVARRHPLPIQCLERSLATSALLAGRAETSVMVGVRRTADGLSAHAWLPSLPQTDDAQHLPLARLSENGWRQATRE